MSTITSKTLSRRLQNLRDAAGQAANLAPAVAAALAERLLPDLELLQKLLSRRLAQGSQELDDGDHARKHAKSRDRHHKELLDQTTAKLRIALIDVRYILDRTLMGKEARAFFEGRSRISRLKSPLIERISARLIALLDDPQFGWENIADAGYRATAEASRLRLKNALADFIAAKMARMPEKHALVFARGSFDRDSEEKRKGLRGDLRLLRGLYEGAGFAREAAALVLRRRRSRARASQPANGGDPLGQT